MRRTGSGLVARREKYRRRSCSERNAERWPERTKAPQSAVGSIKKFFDFFLCTLTMSARQPGRRSTALSKAREKQAEKRAEKKVKGNRVECE